MYVCAYMHVYVHIYVLIYVWMYVCEYVYTCVSYSIFYLLIVSVLLILIFEQRMVIWSYWYIYLISSVQVICHFNILLTEAGVMHEAGYVDYLEHLVPLLIQIFTSCLFFPIWEVLLANARWFLTSWGTYIFIKHAYIFIPLKILFKIW